MRIKIAPSLLSADFSQLAAEIKKVELAGADMLHLDIMDGHFVPNITIGPAVVSSIRKITRLPLDTHLMITRPEKLASAFIEAGSDMITMHIEAISASRFRRQAADLRKKGVRLGISLNPATPIARLKGVLEVADFVLVMSVNPGFSGQKFIPSAISKIKRLRAFYAGDIAVDGGVNDEIACELLDAGANILAAGSYIFGAKDPRVAIERLRHAAGN